MNDITIVYYTANFINDYTGNAIREQLIKAKGNIPLISVSQKPIDFGQNICVGDIGRSQVNIYKQVLIGTREVKTKYVALCEDDCLYSPSHFTSFRPKDDEFAYNMNRWGLYTWSNPPIFSNKNRIVLSHCIAPRDLIIEASEERFKRFPKDEDVPLKFFCEFSKYENHMQIKVRNKVEFNSPEPTIMFSHKEALGYDGLGERKRLGDNRCEEIPYWGTAKEVLKKYFNKEF
jgi:hypothetical protein